MSVLNGRGGVSTQAILPTQVRSNESDDSNAVDISNGGGMILVSFSNSSSFLRPVRSFPASGGLSQPFHSWFAFGIV